jgi:ABC-type multidrug transport system ATPase subunit
MIKVSNIVKTYNKGSVQAVNDISFEVNSGELFGLIGPDGAGKSSIFRILTTLLLADSGTATVNGFDVVNEFQSIRNCIGYMPGRFSLYQDLTIEENLEFFATVFDTTIEENYDLIRDIYVQIEPFKDRRAGKLSGGMKQKLALCCALIHKPEVLFLDEPTTGVDVVSRREFWEMLKKLKQQGLTIIVSTPYMDEASLCDRIALMQGGHILSIDTPANIIASYHKTLYAMTAPNMYKLLTAMRSYEHTDSCFAFGDCLHLTLKSAGTLEDVKKYISAMHFTQVEIKEIIPDIEDCFIKLIKEN